MPWRDGRSARRAGSSRAVPDVRHAQRMHARFYMPLPARSEQLEREGGLLLVRNGLRELWQLELPGGQLWCRVLQGKGYWRDVNSPSHVMRFFALLELKAAPVVRWTLLIADPWERPRSSTVADSVLFSLAAEILIPYSFECGDLQGFSLSQLADFQSASSEGGARRSPDVL